MAWRMPLVALLLALPACGPEGIGGAGAETVELTVAHRSEWRQLWLEGETNLPNGAYVNYRVTHEAAHTTEVADWPATNLIESGRSAVQDGTYWARISTFNWPPGAVRVVVQFPLPPQPPEVVARYGEFGERLAGEHVAELRGMKTVQVEHGFEHRR